MSDESKAPIPEDLQEWHLDTQIRDRAWGSCVVRLLIESIARLEQENAELRATVARLTAIPTSQEIARATAERGHYGDELDDFKSRLWCALGQPLNVEHIAAVLELVAERDRYRALAEWTPITEWRLPKVGDELWGRRAGLMKLPEGYAPMIPRMEDFTFAGWTHFRPINAPQPKSGEKRL